MGEYDCLCTLCGASFYNTVNTHNTAWLKRITILLPSLVAIIGVKCYYSSAFVKKIKGENTYFDLELNGSKGIAIHTDCWKYGNQILGKKIRYEDLYNKCKMKKLYPFIRKDFNYKAIEKYWMQYLDVEK